MTETDTLRSSATEAAEMFELEGAVFAIEFEIESGYQDGLGRTTVDCRRGVKLLYSSDASTSS